MLLYPSLFSILYIILYYNAFTLYYLSILGLHNSLSLSSACSILLLHFNQGDDKGSNKGCACSCLVLLVVDKAARGGETVLKHLDLAKILLF